MDVMKIEPTAVHRAKSLATGEILAANGARFQVAPNPDESKSADARSALSRHLDGGLRGTSRHARRDERPARVLKTRTMKSKSGGGGAKSSVGKKKPPRGGAMTTTKAAAAAVRRRC